MTLELLLAVASFFILSAIIFQATSREKKRRLPPSPLALPFIGHLHLLGPLIHHSCYKLSRRYGPLFHLKLGSVDCVVASTPDMAKELLKTNELSFSQRRPFSVIRYLTYDSAFAFAPYGPYWKFVNKMILTEVLSSRALGQSAHIRHRELHHLLVSVIQRAKVGKEVNITEGLLKFSNNVICQMMMDLRCSHVKSEADDAMNLAREVTKIFGQFNLSDFIWLFKNIDLQGFRKKSESIHGRYDSLIENLISERERQRKKKAEEKLGEPDNALKSFLDVLLDQMEDKNAEIKITRKHIKALFLDFFTAGTDTTAASVDWALAEVLNHPTILKKAQDEINKVVGNSRLVEESDGPNLPYIQAIIKETYRLHPPIPLVTRMAVSECKISGYHIPQNSLLFVNSWAIGRDPKYWDKPLEFRPERFLETPENDGLASSIDVKGQHFQLLPFGTGRRGCPGIYLARQEVPIVLAALLQCFDWKVSGPLDMSERPGLTVPRANDLVCVPVPRIDVYRLLH